MSSETATPQVYWVGERGIMNAAIAHAAAHDCRTAVVQLPIAVKWGNASSLAWVADVKEVNLVVEVGLADFGDPDLIIVCRTHSNQTFVTFLETKVTSYIDSMQSTSPSTLAKWGMEQGGFNRSINGQFSLKYRFAKALSRWDGTSPSISESPDILAAYRAHLNDSEKKSPGRTLSKPSILEIFGRLGLAGLPEEHCHYVALTWDMESKKFFDNSAIPSDCLPVFLDESGADRFGSIVHRVGWVGYAGFEAALDLTNAQEYQLAFHTMLLSVEPPPSFYTKAKPGWWDSFPPNIRQLSDDAAALINGGKLDRRDGSYTILDENRVRIAKIIPNQHFVFIGVRESSQLAANVPSSFGHLDRKRVKDVWFSGVKVTKFDEAHPILNAISNYLRHLPSPAEDYHEGDEEP